MAEEKDSAEPRKIFREVLEGLGSMCRGLAIGCVWLVGLMIGFSLASFYVGIWIAVAVAFFIQVVTEFRKGKSARPAAWVLSVIFVFGTLITGSITYEKHHDAEIKRISDEKIAAAVATEKKAKAEHIAQLKETDPAGYLAALKADGQNEVWLTELRRIDPQAYLADLKQRDDPFYMPELRNLDPKAYADEQERIAAEAKEAEQAEKARLAKLRRSDPKAYLDEIKNQPIWSAEFKALDPKGYKAWVKQQAAEEEARERFGKKLELRSASWHEEYGYAVVEGSVTNLTDEAMRNVLAVAVFFDKNGDIITSDSALIQYQVLLPGQTSPFKVMTNWNPAMHTSTTEFQEFTGGTIPTYYRKRK